MPYATPVTLSTATHFGTVAHRPMFRFKFEIRFASRVVSAPILQFGSSQTQVEYPRYDTVNMKHRMTLNFHGVGLRSCTSSQQVVPNAWQLIEIVTQPNAVALKVAGSVVCSVYYSSASNLQGPADTLQVHIYIYLNI